MFDAILRRIRPEQFREIILFFVIIAMLIFFWTQILNYYDPRAVNWLSLAFAIPMVVAVGQVMVVLTRNIDLSVSSTVALSAYLVGTLLSRYNDLPVFAAVLLSILIGLGLGAINGLIVAYGGVPRSLPPSGRSQSFVSS